MQYNTTQHNLLSPTAQVFSPAHTDDGASGIYPEGRGAGQLTVCDGEEEGQRQEGSSAGCPSTLTAQHSKVQDSKVQDKGYHNAVWDRIRRDGTDSVVQCRRDRRWGGCQIAIASS